MQAALDARMAGHTGIGRYVRCVTGALAALPEADLSLTLFVNPGQDVSWVPASPRLTVRPLPRVMRVFSPGEWTGWDKVLAGQGFELFHVPNFNGPWSCPLPLVVTFHDAIYWRFPRSTGSFAGGCYAKLMLRRSLFQATRVIAVSEASARDARALIGVPASRISVVPHGPPALPPADPQRVAALRETWKAPEGYVLYVGNFLAHKGLDVLVRAMALLKAQGRDLPLVLVGKEDSRSVLLGRLAGGLGLDRAVFAGALEDADLASAYAGARVLVCPSPWEGFGFPMLEGFAASVPVVAVDSGAAPEVAGGAATLARPGDAAGMAEAVLAAWSDEGLRTRLAVGGRQRLQAFSWERAARETLKAYAETTARPGGP